MTINLSKSDNQTIKVLPLEYSRLDSKFCIYCVDLTKAFCLVEKSDRQGNQNLDYCCAMCASGWLEIGDLNNPWVV